MRAERLLLSLSWFCVSMLGLGPTAGRADTIAEPPVDEDAALLSTERRAAARFVTAILPYYSVERGNETLLYLLNLTPYPLAVDVTALEPGGESFNLGHYGLDATSHAAVSLREELRSAPAKFGDGTLVLSFLGDPDTVQAWAVLKRGVHYTEVASVEPETIAASEFFSFWDSVTRGDPHAATYHFFNAGPVPIEYEATVGNGLNVLASFRGSIPAGVRASLTPTLAGVPIARGWITVRHTGDPSALVATGFLEGPSSMLRLPWLSTVEATADREHHSIRIPERRSPADSAPNRGDDVVLTLIGTGSEATDASIQLLDLFSGRMVAEHHVALASREVRSVSLRDAFGDPTAFRHDETRIRIVANQPLAVSGYRNMPGHTTAELTFFRRSEAHTGGSYPLAPLAEAEPLATVVNLDSEPATVLAQVYWQGGTYAIGPLTVPGYGAHRFHFGDLALFGPPDMLGRRLDARYSHAFFKWTVRGDSRSLIGRTEVEPRDSPGDVYGFNCFGCCWQLPSGAIEPNYEEFFPGETPLFQACVYISTCTGPMGPYGADISSMTVPSPFTWDGERIGASSPGYENLGWEGTEYEVKVSCQEGFKIVRGAGSGDSCKHLLRKNQNPAQTWNPEQTCTSQATSCDTCTECCNKIKSWKYCKKKRADLTEGEYSACIGNCLTDLCE